MKHHSTAATLLLVLLALGVLAGPVVAQEENSTATNEVGTTIVGDPNVRIIDYQMQDGSMHITFAADVPTRVTVSAPPSSSGGQAGGYVTQATLDANERTTVAIQAPASEVWISTPTSVENGRFHELSASGPGLIPGPFDANDVLYAGAGAAAAVALAVLYEAVRAEHGEPERGERLA